MDIQSQDASAIGKREDLDDKIPVCSQAMSGLPLFRTIVACSGIDLEIRYHIRQDENISEIRQCVKGYPKMSPF